MCRRCSRRHTARQVGTAGIRRCAPLGRARGLLARTGSCGSRPNLDFSRAWVCSFGNRLCPILQPCQTSFALVSSCCHRLNSCCTLSDHKPGSAGVISSCGGCGTFGGCTGGGDNVAQPVKLSASTVSVSAYPGDLLCIGVCCLSGAVRHELFRFSCPPLRGCYLLCDCCAVLGNLLLQGRQAECLQACEQAQRQERQRDNAAGHGALTRCTTLPVM